MNRGIVIRIVIVATCILLYLTWKSSSEGVKETVLKSSRQISVSVPSDRVDDQVQAKGVSLSRDKLPKIDSGNGGFLLEQIGEQLKAMEAGNAKVSFSKEVGLSYCTIIHIAAPSSQQIATARASVKSAISERREKGIETVGFEQDAEKLLASYLFYAGKFKVITFCVGKGSGSINFFERFVESEKEGLLTDGKYVPMPTDRKHLRYSSNWSPGDWAFDRYQGLLDYHPSQLPVENSGK